MRRCTRRRCAGASELACAYAGCMSRSSILSRLVTYPRRGDLTGHQYRCRMHAHHARYAFEDAAPHGRKKVTDRPQSQCPEGARTDLFLECGQMVAEEYAAGSK